MSDKFDQAVASIAAAFAVPKEVLCGGNSPGWSSAPVHGISVYFHPGPSTFYALMLQRGCYVENLGTLTNGVSGSDICKIPYDRFVKDYIKISRLYNLYGPIGQVLNFRYEDSI